MCIAVVGGSIHRAATRVSAASDHKITTARPSHRTQDGRSFFRSGIFGGRDGVVVTFQNNCLGLECCLWLHFAGSAIALIIFVNAPCSYRRVLRSDTPSLPVGRNQNSPG